MTRCYDFPAGRPGDALDAAVSQAAGTPPASEKLFTYSSPLEVD